MAPQYMVCSLELPHGEKLKLSFQSDLIMLHSDFVSAQFSPHSVGVEINAFIVSNRLEIAFHFIAQGFPNYQKWRFKLNDDFILVETFFRKLGFMNPACYTKHEA